MTFTAEFEAAATEVFDARKANGGVIEERFIKGMVARGFDKATVETYIYC